MHRRSGKVERRDTENAEEENAEKDNLKLETPPNAFSA
jgi:hypothetical protein